MSKTKEALKMALDALEEIALAGMSGTGQESEEEMRDWHAQQAWKFMGIAARVLGPVHEAIAEQEQEPVAIPGPDAERIAILLDKVVRMYPFKRDTEGYEALHLARRIAFRYTIEGDPPLYTSPPAQQEPVAWEDLLGAIARGWTHPENESKTMDVTLAVSIAKEIQKIYTNPAPANQPGVQEWIEQAMSQAQVMASAWSLVGSRFDNGNAMDDFEEAKRELHAMLAAAPEAPAPVPSGRFVIDDAGRVADTRTGREWKTVEAFEATARDMLATAALRAKNGGGK